jgi:hypothetical protein
MAAGLQPVPVQNNPLGINVRPLDFGHAHAPTTMVQHGATISVNAQIVGRVTNWQVQAYSRDGVHIYEINSDTFGRPVDYVASRATGYTITMTRNELWGNELEIAFGFPAVFADLMDQDRPFSADEWIFRGNDIYRQWRYHGCWFQDRNEDGVQAEGDAIYRVNATIAYVSRIRAL